MAHADVIRVVRGPSTGRSAAIDGRVVIGRSDVALRIDDPAVSRVHATVEATSADPLNVRVSDAGSSRGTTLDGVEVTDPMPFPLGGRLRVGRSEVRRLRAVRFRRPAGPELRLRSPNGTETVVTVEDSTRVGRDPASDVRIDDDTVSRSHALFTRSGGSLTVEDAGSRGGVAVNGRRLTERRVVRAGDEIELIGSQWTLVVATAPRSIGPADDFRVRVEGEDHEDAVHVDADPGCSVEAVARGVADLLGLDPSGHPNFYREDGLIFDAAEPWSSVAVGRGELLVLALTGCEASAVSSVPADREPRTVSTAPRTKLPPPAVTFDAPRAPDPATIKGRGIGWQLAGGIAGVVGGLVVAIAFQNWLFAVVGVATGVGGVLFGVLGDQSRRRHQVTTFHEKLKEASHRADAAADAERGILLELSPPAGAWDQLVASGDAPLWQRRPGDSDFVRPTLGIGDRRSSVELVSAGETPDGPMAAALAAAVTPRVLRHVPVQGPAGGVLGLVGSNRTVDALVRHLVLEAAILHAPSSLDIWMVIESEDWGFAAWLPHMSAAGSIRLSHGDRAGAELLGRIAESHRRGRDDSRAGIRPSLVIIEAPLVGAAADLLAQWSAADGLIVIAADHARALPREARTWVQLEGAKATVVGPYPDAPLGEFTPAGLDHDSAARLALALAPLVDPHAPAAAAPVATGLLDLSGVRKHGAIDVGASWRDVGGEGLSAVIGTTADASNVEVDLQRDGPHSVIAGTTGSGKSELLASLLASLIGRYSPEDLSLFLIDFKGGATFNRFADAPHVVGIVTDLEADHSLARRAFAALEAEMARRKRLLGAAAVGTITAFRAISPDAQLPSLVIVIDEFALLVQTQPDVKARLDAVAAQGRSLGMHLMLATQTPSPVMTTAIKANTNLWISLRVVSETESREVIGSVDAARLPMDAPGRAIMRRGAEARLTQFQTGRITIASAGSGAGEARARPLAGARPVNVLSRSSSVPSQDDLDVVLAEARAESSRGRYPPARTLWLPPLSDRIGPDELGDAPAGMTLPVRLGLVDIVAEQRQPTHVVDLATSGLMVTGAPGSGRSTALRQIATDLAEARSPEDVHIYALDANGGLDALTALPHVAAVVQVDEAERVMRMLHRLTSLIEARRSGVAGGWRERVVLLIDDYPAVKEVLESRGTGKLHEQLVSIIGTGRSAGVHVALATFQPTDVRLSVLSGFGNRVMLRAVERTDYQAIEWRPGVSELPRATPGRAVVQGGVELQIVDADIERAIALAAGWPARDLPRPVGTLPLAVGPAGLVAAGPTMDALGLGGPEIQTVGVDATPGAHLVVLGESRTGRSTALRMLAESHLARDGERVAVFAPRQGPLGDLAGRPNTLAFASSPAEADALLAAVAAAPRGTLLLIDDSEQLPSSSADALERMLRQGRDSGLRVAVAARAGDWARAFDGWVRYLTGLKSALLLSDFSALGPVFDMRLDALPVPRAPGRGYLVASGGATIVQVADPALGQDSIRS